MSDPLVLHELAVVFGPVPTDGLDTNLTDDAAIWASPEGGAETELVYWGTFAAGGRDLNGDGGTDFVVTRDIWNGSEYESYVDVFLGGGRGANVHGLVAPQGYTLPAMTADLDGDGFEDLVVARLASPDDDDVRWYSGLEVSAQDGAVLDDLEAGQFDSSGSEHGVGVDLDWFSIGDWDGDGYADLVGSDNDYTSYVPREDGYEPEENPYEYGRLSYYGRALPGKNVATGHIVMDQGGEDTCRQATPWLVNGDEAGGIFCYRLGTDYRDNTLDGLVIFAPGPIVGEVGYSEREHFEVRSLTTSGALLSNPIGGPDATGDGPGDVALMGGEAGVYLFPGFELPWGDPAAW